MIRRVTMLITLITVLTLAVATSAFAAASSTNCTLVGAGAEARDRRADSGKVEDPTGICEMLAS